MQWRGLTRVPFYPELEAFKREPSDRVDKVLSVLLYWHALAEHQDFNARKHAVQLSRSLRIPTEEVLDCLDYLKALGILREHRSSFTTASLNPLKQTKTDCFYKLDFQLLRLRLSERGLNIPIRVLKQSACDHLDFYTYLSDARLPLIQGLTGQLRGEAYVQTCQNLALLLCSLCANPEDEQFAQLAISPAWHMLCQPPVSPEEIASRWLSAKERAIDLDLTDGAFFLPDADSFGTRLPHLWHTGKRREPRCLAAALYLCPTALSEEVHFISDLPLTELIPALHLLYRLTGTLGRIDEAYYEQQELTGTEREQAEQLYEKTRDELKDRPWQPKTDFH